MNLRLHHEIAPIMRLPIVALLVLAACTKAPADRPAGDSTAAGAAPIAYVPAATVPKTALTSMRWIIGTFRGTGAEGTVQEPFFERYSLPNDSTLLVESFSDSTLAGKRDSSFYELRGDSLTDAGATRYTASAISADSVRFSPRGIVRNGFTWRKGDDSSWTAIIIPVGAQTVRTYRMARIK